MSHRWKRCIARCRPVVLLLLAGGIVTGCAGSPKPIDDRTLPSAADYPSAAVDASSSGADKLPPAEGSLWREDAPLISLFDDQKARRVGDILTIRVVESSAATNKASTDTSRASSVDASIDAFFNLEKRFPADHPFFNPFSKVAGGVASDFQGDGTTKRSGDLSATLTALVTRVLPNGNLVLCGSREVLINNENQIIRLTGVVRPRDISADNEVLSTYIADARISYSGSGIVNDRQKPGWLTNLVMTVWPF